MNRLTSRYRTLPVSLHSFFSLSLAALVLLVTGAAPAEAALTITKTTWNVIGLDSNNVNSGPNQFPVGVEVCNTDPGACRP